jgi:hypothetical protein
MPDRTLNINIDKRFTLIIRGLNPAIDMGSGWRYLNEQYGLAESDGITSFAEAVQQAATLPKEEGKTQLFVSGITKGKSTVTGGDRLKALAGRKLADPDILWSLFKEKDQKILHYLHDTYNVRRIEGLRRLLLSPLSRQCAFNLYLCNDGTWTWGDSWLDSERTSDDTALVLG